MFDLKRGPNKGWHKQLATEEANSSWIFGKKSSQASEMNNLPFFAAAVSTQENESEFLFERE